jgi:hypothetical protein
VILVGIKFIVVIFAEYFGERVINGFMQGMWQSFYGDER